MLFSSSIKKQNRQHKPAFSRKDNTMYLKILFHQKKKTFFLLLFLFIGFPVWLIEAPVASAHMTSGGPVAVQHAHAQKALLHSAVLCSGTGCNHQDPYATGCATSMYTVATAYLNAGRITGRVELEYSSVCQTNWEQMYSGNGVEYLAGCVVRNAGSDGPIADDCYQSTRYSWIDTNMLWSPHNVDAASGCFVEECRGGSQGLFSGYYTETGFY
jgi:hypothetical protein